MTNATDDAACRPNTVLMFVFMEQLQRLVGVSSGQPKPVQEKKASEAMKA